MVMWCPAEIAHIQPGGNFDNSRFIDLLKDAYPKPLDAPAAPSRAGRVGAGAPITWLGPGQVAFALALVSCITLTRTKLTHTKLKCLAIHITDKKCRVEMFYLASVFAWAYFNHRLGFDMYRWNGCCLAT